MRKRTKRIYGILLSMSMLLTLLSVPVWAAEPVETGREQIQEQTQEQKQEQQQEQGQTQEPGEGSAQNPEHEHTQACYTLTKNCVHEHTEECYQQNVGTVSGNDVTETVEAQPTECTHVCSEENGCISRRLSCPFEKESSGESQKETLEGSSGINVENALKENELPIVKAPNNNGDVELKQDNIVNYKQGNSGFIYYKLPAGNYSLGEDIMLDGELQIRDTGVSLDLNGHKLEMGTNKISLASSSELAIKDTSQQNGKLITGSEIGIYINWGAKLRVYGGTIDSIITYRDNGAEIYLYGGTIKQNIKFEYNSFIISNAVLYANGGTVEGNLPIPYEGLTIRTDVDVDPLTSTTFKGAVQNCKIEGGIFEGSVENCTIEESAKVTVKFNSNGGNAITPQEISILRGQKAQDPGAPVRDDYIFDGWYVFGNPNSKWNFSGSVTENMELCAKWKVIYKVLLNTNNGTIAAGKELKSYIEGTTVALPGGDDITREGYTFEGWYTDSSFSGFPVTEITGSDTGNKTFYAKWKQNTTPVTPGETESKDTNHDNISRNNNVDYYDTGDTNESSGTAPVIYPTLTFDTCGGSSIKAVRAFEGHLINLSGYLPTREGYQFSGWYADQNLTQPITEIRLDGNRTVYAGWIKQAEQAGENSKPKAAPAQFIADNNEKAVSKDSSQPLIEDYKPGSTDTSEDMEDQIIEDQTAEDTGNDQKSTAENSPADNDSKPDDSADLAPEKTSGNNLGIFIVCAFAGTALIGIIIYIIYKKGSKGARL